MSPWTHVAHHDHPAQAFENEVAHRVEVGDSIDPVPQQLHFVALFGDQSSDQQVVAGTILDGFESTEAFDPVRAW